MLPTFVTYHVERAGEESPAEALRAVLAQVRLADELGFSGAWFAEHHFGNQRGVMPTPLLLALAVAGQTQRLKVGTSIICLPLHNPVAVAEEIAVADLLTGGRLSIGFGSGSAPSDFAVFGSDQPSRHTRFEEGLHVLARCWQGQSFDYDGTHFHVQGVTVVPTPLQRPADFVWLGASSEPTARLAGRLGYGLQLPRGRPPESYLPIVESYREEWQRAGQGAGAPRISIARCIYVGEDDAEALATAEPAVRRFARRWSPAVADTPSLREVVDHMHFWVGGPETVACQLRELQAATGLTHLSMQPTWENLPQAAALASLRRYAERVTPKL